MPERRIFTINRVLAYCAVSSLLVSACRDGMATGPTKGPSIQWREGHDFLNQLSTVVEMEFAESTLQRVLDTLERTQRICCFRDRRVDPGTPIQFAPENQSLANSVRELANQQDLGMAIIGSVVYFGPREKTDKIDRILTSLRQNEARLPKSVRARLEAPTVLRWPILAEPRQVIQDVARRHNLTLEGIDQIPHDLWAARELPALGFLEQMTILTTGFDLTFRYTGRGVVELVPIPDSPTASGSEANVLLPAPPAPRDVKSEERRYTFNVPNRPARDALQILASRFRLQLVIERQVGQLADRRVTVKVQQASQQEAISAVTDAAGLTFKIQRGQLIITKSQE